MFAHLRRFHEYSKFPGRSAAGLAHMTGGHEVGGSNPLAPIRFRSKTSFWELRLASLNSQAEFVIRNLKNETCCPANLYVKG